METFIIFFRITKSKQFNFKQNTMKNLKSLFSVILIAFALITVTSCGDESEDPKPVVPNYIGYWEFQSAVVTPKNGSVYTVTSLCTSKQSPQFNVEFELTSKTEAIQKSSCFSDAPLTYTGTFSNDELTSITFKDGTSTAYVYSNLVINESTKTITAEQTFPMGDANKIVVTFKLL